MVRILRADAAVQVGTVALAANRCKREFMVRCPPARRVVQRRYEARMAAYRWNLPRLDPIGRDVVSALRRRGLAMSSLDELALPDTYSFKEAMTRVAGELETEAQAADDNGSVRPSRARLLADTPVWSWGLSHRLLDIVENYLELPPLYHEPVVSRDLANAPPTGVRQWHRDAEDHRQVKIFIWLRDVEARGGAYEYISAGHSDRIAQDLGYVSGYVGNTELDQIVPRSESRQCRGPAWTVAFSDTARLFHRMGPDATCDRYSVIFSYTSRRPLKRKAVETLGALDADSLHRCLDSRQISCLAC